MNNQEKLSSQIEQEAKEKTMEMHVWMKQDLSEEQLEQARRELRRLAGGAA